LKESPLVPYTRHGGNVRHVINNGAQWLKKEPKDLVALSATEDREVFLFE
jgi:hypothetical protein